jgi:phosphoribosyl 1,2-cyclic phosphate phosphodiesterase
MRLTLLGTGTSMGIPVIGCTCAVCTSSDPRNRRMRTSALLTTAGRTLLFDAGPDFRTQALRAGIDSIDAVLLTHSHFDHIGGLDDLRPLTMKRPDTPMPIYGSPATLADIRARFAYAFDDHASAGSTRPAMQLCPIDTTFYVGDLAIHSFNVMHGSWTITGYRIGRLGYVTDANHIPDASWPLLADLDVLVLNALRHEPHPTHFTIEQALAVVERLRPRRTLLVHMTHSLDHATVNAGLPAGIELAYDGQVIEVAECASQ